MKKIISIVLIAAAVCALASCSTKTTTDLPDDETTIPVTSPEGFEDVTAPVTTAAPVEENTKKAEETTEAAEPEETTEAETTSGDKVSTPDQAVAAAKAWLGEKDEETGYMYTYSYDGTLEEGGVLYHKVRVSWFIEEQGRSSLCGYLLVSPYGDVSKYSW